ncbi:hypothetical protein GCM10010532_029860 [Dactylosporangium siamense]|uniref:Uncharacterized protein n=1 Tax=Dactylosporangium siamense TaxID=685454 RepID=A0A919PKZ0_9ACTN|nr:hypothetical protein Dsi01nite_021040 [Dactylosporangium siamense]
MHRVRPYYWGAIYLMDTACQETFDIGFDGDGPVHATASHAAIMVTHAGTVDEDEADVTLLVRVAPARVAGMPHEVAFDVPSGLLHVGDADGSDDIPLDPPGRWLLQIAVDNPREARHVEIVASPLRPAAPTM